MNRVDLVAGVPLRGYKESESRSRGNPIRAGVKCAGWRIHWLHQSDPRKPIRSRKEKSFKTKTVREHQLIPAVTRTQLISELQSI